MTITKTEEVTIQAQSAAGYWQTIWWLFSTPGRAFQSLKQKPRWLIPFILCILIALTVAVSTSSYRMEDIKRSIQNNPEFSRQEIDRRLANIEAQRTDSIDWNRIRLAALIVGVMHAVKVFGLAFVLWLILLAGMNNPGFKRILAFCSFYFLVLIPEAILKTPLIIAKKTMNIHLGLAALLTPGESNFLLVNLFNKIDIISIWMIALMIIALPIITEISRRKAAYITGGLWGLWFVLATFLGNAIQIV